VNAVQARDDVSPGAVYTLSNEAGGNRLVVFRRNRHGGLTLEGTVATEGLGSGIGLGSQGALIFGHHKHALYAVNAGSNNLSVIEIGRQGPRMIQVVDSGGLQPISLTARTDTLYALNNGSAAGDVDQIAGFQIDPNSLKLSLLANSVRGLSAPAVGPAQLSFDREGKILVITEKTTNHIDTFLVDRNGYASGILVQPSSGMTPFGFALTRKGYLIVSEAFGGASGASAVSSYRIDSDTGMLHVVSPSVPTLQTAACWVAVTANGRFAYSTNTGSGTITGFLVHHDGSLTRKNDNGITGVTGGAPIDAAVVGDKFLYVLSNGQDQGQSVVTGFEIEADGSLELIGSVGGLPGSAVGLAAM
jgi:6-phosphogluconolactonase (cycloisomerase 2 family)